MIYLDHNSSTMPLPHLWDIVGKHADVLFANPDSTHSAGRLAKAFLEESRGSIASLIGVEKNNILFTSGATESNAQALRSYLNENYEVLALETEHNSVLKYATSLISVNTDGTINLSLFEERLRKSNEKPVVACIMYANNETGVISDPTLEAARLCNKYNAKLHIDASQCYFKGGQLPKELVSAATTISMSGHKMRAFRGAGTLYFSKDIQPIIVPLYLGGNQEFGLRPGTTNLQAIWSMGLAASEAAAFDDTVLKNNIKYIEQSLSDISVVNGSRNRISNTTNLYFKDINNTELFIEELSENGVCVSGMSACDSGFSERSHVLEAMFGKDSKEAQGSIRISICDTTSKSDIDKALEIIKYVVAKVK